jgi:CDP-glucose 4,6-dehydratase
VTGFYAGRTVLVTGHTGLLGQWVVALLTELGAIPVGLARGVRPDPGRSRTVAGDVRDFEAVRCALVSSGASVVLHLAAQAHARVADRRATYETNVLGTVNILEAVAESEIPSCVVTSGSRDPRRVQSDREAQDPYNASKFAAEHAVMDYRRNMPGVGIARPAVLIGGGDCAAGRLVPEIMAALRAGRAPEVRAPAAYRPWQHAVDAAHGLLLLAAALASRQDSLADAYEFGPAGSPVSADTLSRRLAAAWAGEPARGTGCAPEDGYWMDSAAAAADLGWAQRWSLDEAVDATVRWHRAQVAGQSEADAVLAHQARQFLETQPCCSDQS